MHLQSQNYVEAALTLKLHSDLHQWDLNTFVNAMDDLGLPQQSQFHRKETLCLLILDYLGEVEITCVYYDAQCYCYQAKGRPGNGLLTSARSLLTSMPRSHLTSTFQAISEPFLPAYLCLAQYSSI